MVCRKVTLSHCPPLDPLSLPESPTAYRLALNVDPNQLQHSGEVTIAVSITQPGTVIRLNAAEIKVSSAVLDIQGEKFNA